MKHLFLSFSVLVMFSCKSQEKKIENLTVKKDTMEYFDINKYKNLPINPKTGFQILPNGDEVQYFTGSQEVGFVERTKIKNSSYTIVKVFYQNNILKAKGKDFYNFSLGIDEEFNENGKLIKEINHDLPFKLSVEDLAKQMKEKYNMDIMNVQKTFLVNRFVDTKNKKIPIYEIYYRDEIKPFVLNCYVINGTTGEVLFTAIRYDSEEKQGSSYQNYLDSLKK